MNLHKPTAAYSGTIVPGKINGHAVIELALVVPILFLICVSALDIAYGLSGLQAASALSKELASFGYRMCAVDRADALAEQSVRQTNAADCLNAAQNRFLAELSGVAPDNAYFILSLYTIDSGTITLEAQITGFDPADPNPPQALPSKFTSQHFSTSTAKNLAYANALERFQTLVVAEVYVPHELSGVVPLIYSFSPRTMYGSTII